MIMIIGKIVATYMMHTEVKSVLFKVILMSLNLKGILVSMS